MKAFPNAPFSDAGRQQDTGMDLRDYFAAHAMQGMLAHTGVIYGKTASLDDSAGAIRAYEIADKMMKAREFKNETR
jgi:hypothetical protein